MTKTASQKKRAKQSRNTKAQKQGKKTQKAQRNNSGIGSAIKTAVNVGGRVLGIPGVITRPVGSGLARLFGSGDYRVSQNSLFSGGLPSFGDFQTPMRVRHREYLGVVNTQTAYSTQLSINLNPGLLAPILSQISQSFTMYKFHGLVFMYNSTSATAVSSTNTALGVTGMVVNYDPTAANFSSRQAAEEYVGCQAATPSTNLMLPVECKPSTTLFEKRWIRYGSTNKPLGECDLGKFQFFADGAQASSQAGELWVAYDVEFYLPRLNTSVGASVDYYNYTPNVSWNQWYRLKTVFATLTSKETDSGRIVFKQPGTYICMGQYRTGGVSTTNPYPTIATLTFNGCTETTKILAGRKASPWSAVSATDFGYEFEVTVTQPGQSVDNGYGNGNINDQDLMIVRVPDNVLTSSVSFEEAGSKLSELVREIEVLRSALYSKIPELARESDPKLEEDIPPLVEAPSVTEIIEGAH